MYTSHLGLEPETRTRWVIFALADFPRLSFSLLLSFLRVDDSGPQALLGVRTMQWFAIVVASISFVAKCRV